MPSCCGACDPMIVGIIYIAATVGVTIYMLVALLRPEDF
jgi:K+-transporting ATPase KdpF subunit